MGSVFSFESGVIPTITSNSNTYKQCHTVSEGAIF